jgi:hypothetical protein
VVGVRASWETAWCHLAVLPLNATNTGEPNLDSGLICTTAHVGLEVESDGAWDGRAVETLTLCSVQASPTEFRFRKAWHSARRPYNTRLNAVAYERTFIEPIWFAKIKAGATATSLSDHPASLTRSRRPVRRARLRKTPAIERALHAQMWPHR